MLHNYKLSWRLREAPAWIPGFVGLYPVRTEATSEAVLPYNWSADLECEIHNADQSLGS